MRMVYLLSHSPIQHAYLYISIHLSMNLSPRASFSDGHNFTRLLGFLKISTAFPPFCQKKKNSISSFPYSPSPFHYHLTIPCPLYATEAESRSDSDPLPQVDAILYIICISFLCVCGPTYT